MCRLFGQLAPTPRSAHGFLVDAEFCLLRQADFDKTNVQGDGWGLGWRAAAGALEIEKSPAAAFAEPERFRAAALRGVSTGIVGHLRAASNPRGLPREQLINLENTQPFTDGRWLFGHNGTLNIPAQVQSRLGDFASRLRSKNDSEVYFWQFRKFFEKTGDPAAAFEACVAENWDLWREARAAHPDKQAPYSSMNAVVSDGSRLFAFCHSAAKGLGSCGVCNPAQPWQTMSFTQRDGALTVASENLDRGPWTRLEPPEVLVAALEGGAVVVTRTRYEGELSDGRLSRRRAPAEEAR